MGTAIRLEGLVKRYGRTLAVDDVSLEVGEGESFGYLGPNGAGKTTTIRCMLGLIRPTAGRIRVLGRDVAHDLHDVLADVGHLPGEFELWPQMSGAECLSYLGDLHPRPPERMRELCDLFELSRRDLARPVRRYSRGMKQKIGIIQAFQHRPRLVILDEPTGGLDPLMRERFVELLQEHRAAGGTTFISSHILSEVERATDRVGVVREGRLVKAGATTDLAGERLRHCTLVLRASPTDPVDLARIPGVSDFGGDGSLYRFDHRGNMGPLLGVLAELPVEEFLAEPASLAETFFEVYGGADR